MNEGSMTTYSLAEVQAGFAARPDILIKTESIQGAGTLPADAHPTLNGNKKKIILNRDASAKFLANGAMVVEGANLIRNEYGNKLFADFFFFITGFHGFHVFTGVLINIIIFFNVILGTYEKRRSYEMVEKVGLYWHFVDLVWVFVFTFFYLV